MTGCNPKPEGRGRLREEEVEVVLVPLLDGPWPVVGLLLAGEAELACRG